MSKLLGKKICNDSSMFVIAGNNMVRDKFSQKINIRILAESIIYNISFLCIILFLFQINYETNDDLSMANIASMGEAHLVYINIIIGYLLKFLWHISPLVPWYPILEVICIYWSLVFIDYVLLRNIRKEQKVFKNIIIVVSVFSAYYLYSQLQFTKVASVLLISGIILILDNFLCKKVIAWEIIIAVSQLAIGIMYRKSCFFMIAWAMLPILLVCLVFFIRNKMFKRICLGLFLICMTLFLYWAEKEIDRLAYSNEEWSFYSYYNSVRGQLLDHGFPDYYDNESLYNELNMREEDVRYFRNWNFADPKIFNIESIEKLVERQQDIKEQFVQPKQFFRLLFNGYTQYGWILLPILSFLGLMASNKWCRLFGGIQIVNFIFIQWYLFFSLNRYLQQRVDISIALAIVYTNIFVLIKRDDRKKNEIRGNVLCALISVVLMINISNSYNYVRYDNEDSDYSIGLFADDMHLYCNLIGGSSATIKNDIWYRTPYAIHEKKHTMAMGGTTTYIPWDAQAMKNFDVENPYEECVDNDHIYIVGRNMIEPTVSYIQRHYDCDAYAWLVKEIDGRFVYKIKSQSFGLNTDNAKNGENVVEFDYSCLIDNQDYLINVEAYKPGNDSYMGECYTEIVLGDGTKEVYQMTQLVNDKYEKHSSERYSNYILRVPYEDNITFNFYYVYNDEIYIL